MNDMRLTTCALSITILLSAFSGIAEAKSKAGPQIDVVVTGPGTSYLSAFGHVAVRVRQTESTPNQEAELFNFGVATMKRTGFLLNFALGKARYWGNRRTYAKQRKIWTRQDRSIHLYRLKVSADIARKIHHRLRTMVNKENREFQYDLFRNNCVTKIRDVIDDFTNGSMTNSWRSERVEGNFRSRASVGYSTHPAAYFAIRWFPGRAADARVSAKLRSGEPAFFEAGLAAVKGVDGRPLFGAPVIDYQRRAASPVGHRVLWFPIVHWLAAVLLLGLGFSQYPKAMWIKGLCLMGTAVLAGLLGTVMVFLHFWSQWLELQENLLMFLVWPTDLVLIFPAIGLLRGQVTQLRWVCRYLQAHVALGIFLTVAGLLIEGLNGPMLPRVVLTCGWLFTYGYYGLHRMSSAVPKILENADG
jgi:hypothetical protein